MKYIPIQGGGAAVGRPAPYVGVYGMYFACILIILIIYLINFIYFLNYLIYVLNILIYSQSGFDFCFGHFENNQMTDIKPRAASQTYPEASCSERKEELVAADQS